MATHSRSIRFLVSLVATLVLASACSGNANSARGPSRDRNMITTEELATVNGLSAYEVVQRLRPHWLNARGGARSLGLRTEIVVFSDNIRLGGVEALRNLPANGIRQMEYLDGPSASNRLPGVGSGEHIAGAIVIHRINTRP